MGIEPTPPAWKAGVLPLNYARLMPDTNPTNRTNRLTRIRARQEPVRWGRQDSNLRRLRHQIYSLAHLAALEHPLNACNYSNKVERKPSLNTPRLP